MQAGGRKFRGLTNIRQNLPSDKSIWRRSGVKECVGAKQRPENSELIEKRTFLWIITVIAAAVAVTAIVVHYRTWKPRLTALQGAVIRSDMDTHKQEPISGAVITASHGVVSATSRSDASGYFKINFPQVIWPGEIMTINVSHPDYHSQSLEWRVDFRRTVRRLIIVALQPIPMPVLAPVSGKPATVISDIRIRYTVNAPSEESIGSAARTFQVVNQGNVPCRHQGPCSPDGNWKAATNSITLDAGLGNQYRDVRASCIAGPCPFTRIDTRAQGRTIVATAVDWSDTATFLLEAEVFHTSIDASVRQTYPVIFDQSLSFTLPAAQEGVTIEADVGGTAVIFPVGPDVYLDWATCTVRTNPGQQKSIVYQCALKPGYRFAGPPSTN